MAWLRLTISSDASHIEDIGALLEQFGAVSLSYVPMAGEPLFDEGEKDAVFWEETAVTALLDEDTDLDILIACLRNRVGAGHIHSHRIAPLQDEAWCERHKQEHGPMVFAGRLCVCPSWSEPPAGITHLVSLDPGLAFGTGSHPTTRLCLEWLASRDVRDRRIIDYGCGSGVLGLAALALGASHVHAVDTDSQALAATRDNADHNSLTGGISIGPPGSVAGVEADILLANILLNPLLALADQFAERVVPGGQLVLSGLLAQQAGECLEAYRPWFKMEAPRFSNEWAMLSGSRR